MGTLYDTTISGNCTNGDYIIEQLYNGNWKDGVKNLLEIYSNPNQFADFIDKKEEEGLEFDFLGRGAFVAITNIWHDLRK